MSSAAIHMDSKSRLVDLLSDDEENSRLSLNNFPNKRSIEAVYLRYKAENMLMQFARNPNVEPELPPELEPTFPVLPQDATDEEIKAAEKQYRKDKAVWNFAKQAVALKISLDDFIHIKENFVPFDRAINSLPGVKGKRWHSLTKNLSEEQKKGIAAMIAGSES